MTGETGTDGDDGAGRSPAGAYASQLVVVPKPRRLSFAQPANLLLVGTTAAEVLNAVSPGAGETVTGPR